MIWLSVNRDFFTGTSSTQITRNFHFWPQLNFGGITLRASAELSVLPRIGLLETRIPEVPLLTCQAILRTRLKLVFGIEIETCAQCGGKVKVIASIEDPAAVP